MEKMIKEIRLDPLSLISQHPSRPGVRTDYEQPHLQLQVLRLTLGADHTQKILVRIRSLCNHASKAPPPARAAQAETHDLFYDYQCALDRFKACYCSKGALWISS